MSDELSHHARQVECMKLLCDFLLLVAAWLPVIIFKAVGVPFERGFYCDDGNIRHPFRGSTVPNWLLFTFGSGIPIFTIIFTELVRLYMVEKKTVGQQALQPVHKVFNRSVHPFVSRCYLFIGYFLVGSAFTVLLTDVCKYSIGRLRPHFLSVCDPDYTKIDCYKKFPGETTSLPVFVENVTCRGDPDVIKEARLSFLSGHASFSFFGMVFMVLYLEARTANWMSHLLKPCLQLVYLTMAVATGLSRVSDYKHHPTDVLAGALLGTIVALIVGVGIVRLFRPYHWLVVDKKGRSLRNGAGDHDDDGLDIALNVDNLRSEQKGSSAV